ncbi:protein WEAK CHLOROPLAST MOVEMENT UNDER BLUE LIGHT 1-like [Myripristis murdjan]|uniref:Protein WEAK CHLOROPLAST MOVEMENT UNDER BLUE LIGHT 1-like n=1 Tax=Myripristis murdjan TaxID=586833 RepID=A0A667WYP6_9TELE|nr:protein WEAK CHLOROPLAST MOVEMENT UNDER BLUE LIGHT 1-like [Myripristis murdjan]
MNEKVTARVLQNRKLSAFWSQARFAVSVPQAVLLGRCVSLVMAKRKSKSGTRQHEDTCLLLDSPVSAPRSGGINSHVLPTLLLLLLAVVGSMLGWYCVQQQQYSLDQLSQSYTAMQTTITKLEQVAGWRDAHMDAGLVVEERILALEEAQKLAQQKAEVALATSEKLTHTDLHSQIWALRAEMDVRSTEMQQAAISTASLRAIIKNQSEEFEALKGGLEAMLSSSSALAANVAGLSHAVTSANSRVDEQVTLVEALNTRLEGQAAELNELKVSLDLHNAALYTNNQEVAAIKQFVEAAQATRALGLEEKLSSVQRSLDEQFFTSQTLHYSIKAQLQNVHTQLVNGGQIGSQPVEVKFNKDVSTAEEFISATAEDAAEDEEEQLVNAEKEAEVQDAPKAAEQQVEEDAVQEEQPLEKEMTGLSEEHEAVAETGEEEVTEHSTETHDLEESSEEEELEDALESEVVDEQPVELDSEVLVDEDE